MDNSILKSDVFFFIATIALVVIAALFAAGIIYLITILRLLKRIAQNVKTGSDVALSGIQDIRGQLEKGTFRFASLLQLLKIIKRKSKSK